jgi:hypothetical protein
MATLELENNVATTDRWTTGPSLTDQGNPATRRVTIDAFLSELETLAIERNEDFHATIVERLGVPEPDTVSSDDVLAD